MAGSDENSGDNSGATTKKQRGGIENLKPFKPGQSGNPNGRPKGKRDQETLYYLAAEGMAIRILDSINEKRRKQKLKPLKMDDAGIDPELDIWLKVFDKARNGDLKAFELINNFRFGRPKQPVEHANKDGEAFALALVDAAKDIDEWQGGWFKEETDEDQKTNNGKRKEAGK